MATCVSPSPIGWRGITWACCSCSSGKRDETKGTRVKVPRLLTPAGVASVTLFAAAGMAPPSGVGQVGTVGDTRMSPWQHTLWTGWGRRTWPKFVAELSLWSWWWRMCVRAGAAQGRAEDWTKRTDRCWRCHFETGAVSMTPNIDLQVTWFKGPMLLQSQHQDFCPLRGRGSYVGLWWSHSSSASV